MRTLLLLRHAKSSWKDPEQGDHSRPLNVRGKKDAPRAGSWLHQRHLVPDLILSSSAKRARKTAAKVAKSCGYQGIIEIRGELYLAPPDVYRSVVNQLPEEIQCPLVVGHNPGMAEWIAQLTSYEDKFPTAALAQVELEIDHWSELQAETPAQLVRLWFPKLGEVDGNAEFE